MAVLGSLLVLVSLPAAQAVQWPACAAPREEDTRQRAREDASRNQAWDIAAQFAPILEFAPGERYFPTVPFFTAFDGRDNSGIGPGRRDFEDPLEIGLVKDSLTGKASWSLLDSVYRARNEPDGSAPADRRRFALDRSVVFYRMCTLTDAQNRTIRRFLVSDEQAWERAEEDFPAAVRNGVIPYLVIQYFLYYVRDQGLQGHPQDIELVSVFLPEDRSLWKRFRIVVGSGHSTRTPNNVLVLSADHRGVRQLHDSLFVLVELGGHSSSPDLPPYGRYTPGVDVNWHIYDVWGTRDVQAIAGIGFQGRYTHEMTFERVGDAVTLYPPTTTARDRYCAEYQLKQAGVRLPPECAPLGQEAPAAALPTYRYRLVPVDLFVALDRALDDTVARRRDIPAAVTEIQDWLCEREPRETPGNRCGRDTSEAETWNARRFVELGPAAQSAAIAAMQAWKGPMLVDTRFHRNRVVGGDRMALSRAVEPLAASAPPEVAAARHRIWDHESYRGAKGDGANPTLELKPHLFRPTVHTIRTEGEWPRLILFGVKGVPSEGVEAYTGLVVPAFRSRGLPVRFSGFMELHAGVYRRDWWRSGPWSLDLGVLLEAHRNAAVSWYVAGNWVPRRAEVIRDPEAGEFSFSGGLSLLPFLSEEGKNLGPINAVRIRVGPRIDPFNGEDLLGGVRWEFHLAVRQ